VLRRARGLAPLPITLATESEPVLAVGAHQKNAIAAALGAQVFISQHIGDLETEGSHHAFRQVIGTFERLYDFTPARVACDLHPDYASTQHAASLDLPIARVQHHHAHILACMAENRLVPPVLGIAWDGSGMGDDGTVWGGEFLHITSKGCARVAHLRPFLLPGNEKAVREPRRSALALLFEIFGDEAIVVDAPTVRAFSPAELATLRTMLDRQLNSPLCTSAGRLFDAFASLLGLRQVAGFEGQAAMELEYALADTAEDDSLPFTVKGENGRLVLDWEPAVRAVLAQPAPPAPAARFHNMLVEMAVEVAKRIGEDNVVFSGGCFQNRYLTERMVARLRAVGHRPYWHQRVPPNDGGIALGQIVAAQQQKERPIDVSRGSGQDPQH
jgi:hydrogenase maturation protein HypF